MHTLWENNVDPFGLFKYLERDREGENVTSACLEKKKKKPWEEI